MAPEHELSLAPWLLSAGVWNLILTTDSGRGNSRLESTREPIHVGIAARSHTALQTPATCWLLLLLTSLTLGAPGAGRSGGRCWSLW